MRDQPSTQAWIALAIAMVFHSLILIPLVSPMQSAHMSANRASLVPATHAVDTPLSLVITKTHQIDGMVSTIARSAKSSLLADNSTNAAIVASAPVIIPVVQAAPESMATQARAVLAVNESELAIADPVLSADAFNMGQAVPVFPPISRILGESGIVDLHIHLNADGFVTEVQVINSSGYSRLDQAALEAVSHWQLKSTQAKPSPTNGYQLSVSFAIASSV